jgi:hypothetical protein
LYDEIHALAACNTLQQSDAERRLALDGAVFADTREHARAAGGLKLGGELAASTIEQHHVGPIAKSQYLAHVPHDLGRQFDELT